MSLITHAHFGANVILTRDSLNDGQPFAETLKEIDFSSLRYPGGGVTEDQTWANGGLDRMFGDPMDPGSDNYVLTIHEALDYAAATGKSLSIVTPTFQFYDKAKGTFDHDGFGKYLDKLEEAIAAQPSAHIKAIEIGNEYWGSKQWGSLTGSQYGEIANAEIPEIDAMIGRLSEANEGWQQPKIGIQAGNHWRAEQNDDGTWTAVGPQESLDIISSIDLDNRGMVETVVQHSYPYAHLISQNLNWAVRPMEVFEKAAGFTSDLEFALTEFNIGLNSAVGIDQASAWVEAFSGAVDRGIDAIDHWGISYNWLSNKFYDTKFPPAESDDGSIVAIATPMGQIYDIAQTNLIGKTTMTDAEALQEIGAPRGFNVTGFEDETQKIVFLHNPTDKVGRIDLSEIADGKHLTTHFLTPADSPETSWYDESSRELPKNGEIADSRGDMKVTSGHAVKDSYALDPGEMLVVTISDADRDLVIEGAHNVTDPRTGMVDDHISGGLGDDILRGHVGDDTLEGGGGKNAISGGKGNDHIEASDEGDVIFADGGDDTIMGGKGDDLVFASSTYGPGTADITGGGGHNLFLIGAEKDVLINDFTDQDWIGFDGAFKDAGSLQNAAKAIDDDLVVEMPDGSQVVLTGQAGMLGDLHEQVLDFLPRGEITEITDHYLAGLTYSQVEEVFDLKADGFEHTIPPLTQETGLSTATVAQGGSRYFDSFDETVDRLGIEKPDDVPHHPDDGGSNPDDVWDDWDDEDNDDGNSGADEGGGSIPDHPHDRDEDENPPTPDEEPYEEQDQETGSGGACFIATAAFGNPHHPDVVALRAFRDNHLIKARAGRAFVKFYWVVGPWMAHYTKPQQGHAVIARHLLSATVALLRRANLTTGR